MNPILISLFPNPKPIIGVIHVGALPGAPANTQTVDEIVAQAVREAAIYRDCGVDGIIIENMHDTPYLRGSVGPEIVAAMAVIGHAVKTESRLADEGLIQSSAAELLRYRKMIGAGRVQVWADVKKKHSSHAITADISLGATAEAVEFMRGDAVIVTGSVTGEAPKIADVEEANAHCRLPVLLGSGIDANNIADFYQAADGFIIGSHFKADGHWANPVEAERVRELMKLVERIK
ncbi:MAG: BtpA/SgcQ family protein [Blastocatellia bacterium]